MNLFKHNYLALSCLLANLAGSLLMGIFLLGMTLGFIPQIV